LLLLGVLRGGRGYNRRKLRMPDKPNHVNVDIFGQSYAVRAGAEPGYIERLAAFVDSQMRDVSRGSGAVDTQRAAVLAALNIADECFRARADAERARELSRHEAAEQARAKAATLVRELDTLLQD
jgi:cell division protein ZapA